jgi:hypothetical protein
MASAGSVPGIEPIPVALQAGQGKAGESSLTHQSLANAADTRGGVIR